MLSPCVPTPSLIVRKDACLWRARFHVRWWRRETSHASTGRSSPTILRPSRYHLHPQLASSLILTSIMAAFSRRKAASSSATKTSIRGCVHTVWRLFAWAASTGYEGWFLLYHSPVHSGWINLACLIAMAVINWLIVAKPLELYRRDRNPARLHDPRRCRPFLAALHGGWLARLSARQRRQPGLVRPLWHALRRVSDRAPLRRTRPHTRSYRRPFAGRYARSYGALRMSEPP